MKEPAISLFLKKLALPFCILVAVLTAFTIVALNSYTPVWKLVALSVFAHVPYVAMLFLLWRMRLPAGTIKIWWLVAGGLALRLLVFGAPPVFSDDIYRYVWDGKVTDSGVNPYQYAPDAHELESLRNDDWQKINHKTYRTIYPPVAQGVFGFIALWAPHIWAFKLTSVFADLLVILLMAALAKSVYEDDPPDKRMTKVVWVSAAYAFNPLVCIETGASGHMDPIALALMLLGLLLFKRGFAGLSASLVGLSIGAKIAPLLIVPVLARKSIVLVVVPLVLFVLYLPFLSAGSAMVETLDSFGRKWEGNAGLFSCLKWFFQWLIGGITGAKDDTSMVHLPILDELATALRGTFFTLHKDGVFDPVRPGAFSLGDLSLFGAKFVGACILICVIVIVVKKKFEPVRATMWIFSTLIIVTPVMHPWYISWVLVPAIICRVWPWLVFAATLHLAYLPLEEWWNLGVWNEPVWIVCAEYAALMSATAAFALIKRRQI